MGTVRIVIEGKTEGKRELFAEAGRRLDDILREEGVYLSEPCGGVGKCGKCRILVLAGEFSVTEQDRNFFDEKELAKGYRLACMARVEGDLTIRLTASGEERFEVLAGGVPGQIFSGAAAGAVSGDTRFGGAGQSVSGDTRSGGVGQSVSGDERSGGVGQCVSGDARSGDAKKSASGGASFVIAVDIGTTTLAAALIDRGTGAAVATAAVINHQRAYGADVVSRIQAACEGKGGPLQKSIRADLHGLVSRLLSENGVRPEQVGRVALSGNTTMGHLLMGYPCEGLGAYPFTPHSLEAVTDRAAVFFGEETALDCPVTLLPGISAYVGGDIAAGLLACKVYEKEEPVLLLDLGTNGEMALGNRERIFVTSVAAGPAFEGGNISCGTGSIPGAICSVSIRDGAANVATIGDAPANGLCGTGVIETTRELLVNGLIDETGLLDQEYEDGGFPLATTPEGEAVTFTQRDVREIQLAKSAVRAGVETLFLRYGISCDEVAAVYVAGGFGFHLDIGKAVDIGLLPEALRDKVHAVGNSSLQGAVGYLTKTAAPERLAQIIAVSEEVALAMDKDFNELYMEHMMFDDIEQSP